MAAASACSNFCSQNKHVCAQVPTRDKGEPPLKAWGHPGQLVLPGFSPFCPACSPLGCGHTQPTDIWPTSAWACLRQTYPEKPPSIHTRKWLRVTWVWWERGPGQAWGSHVTFLFLQVKGQRPFGGGVGRWASVDHVLTDSVCELSWGPIIWEGEKSRTSWQHATWLGAALRCEAWRPRFRILLGSVARKWHQFLGSLTRSLTQSSPREPLGFWLFTHHLRPCAGSVTHTLPTPQL